jgi:hypothetical protein
MRSDQAKDLIRDLTHGGDYSPEERRAYYLRTRKLKGRQPGKGSSGGAPKQTLRFSTPTASKTRTVVTKNDASARQAAIVQKVGLLKKRLDILNKKLVEAREKASKKNDKKGAKSSDPKSSSKSDSKDQKPLSAADKREKAKKEKERYEKEEKVKEPETEEEILAEIQKVESNIRAVLSAARKKPN